MFAQVTKSLPKTYQNGKVSFPNLYELQKSHGTIVADSLRTASSVGTRLTVELDLEPTVCSIIDTTRRFTLQSRSSCIALSPYTRINAGKVCCFHQDKSSLC
jgi:hypothetical protein